MKATLHIARFGPIKDLHIELNKYSIFIGPHASGKSTVSKVLAVIHGFDYTIASVAGKTRNQENLRRFLSYYRIENYLTPETRWFYDDGKICFELNGKDLKIEHKLKLEDTTKEKESYYFPAERIALPMLNNAAFEVMLTQSTLPPYFLQFGIDFTRAREQTRRFHLPQLRVEYEYTEGQNRVFHYDNQSFLLQEASSAIQANLPLLVILQYPINVGSLLVIEELELHAFPLLQKQLLYYVIERMRHPQLEKGFLVLPTHSPYILSAANNLLFAAKVASQNDDTAAAVEKLIGRKAWLDPREFSAYYFSPGQQPVSIVSPQTGLIDENALDNVSEDLAAEFDELMHLYKPQNA